ncbi:imidazole glycerol phosphate synthase cyclase subunit [Candidatus Njordibacter sp. Uisw_056]|uniref:imidazole glycerol phosphate synthase cyclase subunit n=1 Tax=Candidatus Njordibacter sp. Uisw_056 TaxID=3230973 RepID=UPI003D40C4D5
MLKRRIIPIQLLSGDRFVKTTRFSSPRDVGDPVKSSRVYSDNDADELLILQIDRGDGALENLHSKVLQIANECFAPLTAGGAITKPSDALRLFSAGADKVVLNSICYTDLEIISDIANFAGSQAVVVAVDVKFERGRYVLYSGGGRVAEPISLEKHIGNIIDSGAGEILVQSIDHDGVMDGYDLNLLDSVCKACSLPVIIAGGAGNFIHLKEAFQRGADAVACGSIFNFGDNSPLRAKAFLKNYGVPLKKI